MANDERQAGKRIIIALVTVLIMLILIPIVGLIVESVLDSSVFTGTTIINVTLYKQRYSEFADGATTFLQLIGLILGISLLVVYLKPIFSKEDGVQGFAA